MTYDVWRYNDGDANVIPLVSKSTMTSGNLDLREMPDWAIARGWLPATSTIHLH